MQRAFGMVVDRPLDQQLLAIGGNFIGALRGAEHRHGNAYDRHGDDDADQGEETKARSIQARLVRLPGGLRLRRRQHSATFRHIGRAPGLGAKTCK
jgi:hypothetical protein